ncbi:hypothetical protein PMAYCL1PPCAC_20961, partial [Pristionchus mayeri]
DFEKGLSNALNAIFPNTVISRCAFHYFKAVYSKLQSIGLSPLYGTPAYRNYFKSAMALAFVDPLDVPSYFDKLKEEALDNLPIASIGDSKRFFEYLEATYVGSLAPNGIRRTPQYPITTWNVYHRVLNGQQIGNSTIEGYNSKLKAVPANSSAQKVAEILLEHQQSYSSKLTAATSLQLTLAQTYPQKPTSAKVHSQRKTAISNGSLGKSEIDHLFALCAYVHVI